ncbi:hypothetical protein ACWC4D_16195 [Streptomyces sp. NPDC001288]|uniref:hypothetical protein n=1 Tax=Streptomyces sp. NPDC001297 TaxID=3364559 RepID=UPI0036B8FF89
MTARTAPAALVEDVAGVVENVPGVAFLRPGLADRLRSALSAPGPGAGRTAPASGVRMAPGPDGTGAWHVDVQVVTVRRARALDVARAVRAAVQEHLAPPLTGGPVPTVTVTVTGQV